MQQRRGVVGEVGLEDVEAAVAVVVGHRRAHSRLRAAVFIERSAGYHGHVGEGSVAVVVVQNARRTVARDEDVGPAVVVVVERGDAERIVAAGLVDVGFRGDIFEGAVAAIVVKNVFRGRQSSRPAHHRRALPHARWALARSGRGREIEVNIVCDDEIEFAVAIVVNESATRAPRLSRSAHACLVRHIGEDAVIVVIEMVLAVVSDVEIFPAIVIVVADADALSPAARGQARFRGDIGERAIVIVVVEMIRRAVAGFRRFQGCTVDDEDVRPAIIVVIEDGDACSGCLDDVLLAVETAEDLRHREPGLPRDVNEVGDGLC